MYFHIETLKQRLEAINQLRLERAYSVMNLAAKKIYRLLPIFFHCHHPLLPGFIEGKIPHGVCFYQPEEDQYQYISELIGDFSSYTRSTTEQPITGIYSMGSTASIGQSQVSDIDIWVCHQSWLDDEERKLLQKKCQLIEQWALAKGVEINFFLIDESRFRTNKNGVLSCDNCGTTQHILLLDEFYRTSVHLAGRRVLWNMVPKDKEKDYDEYVLSLYASGALDANRWLDLGGLNALSAEEYFGASLWQLYKSIDSPYKSVLKVLLLEAYSWEYPETSLLSMDIRHCLHQGEIISFGLDPYCMMLERVSRYLLSIKDYKRLEVVRRCFYLKVTESCMPQLVWRQNIIDHYVKEWGWSNNYLNFLNNRKNWKIEQVRAAHDELLDVLMQSYRNLIRFARANNLTTSASPQDIGILTRKLYVAFEQLPGKILLINPQISPDLSEENLTFINVGEGKVNRAGWYLYNKAPTIFSIIGCQPLEHHHYLSKLVAWSYFNGLLTPKTQLFIKGNNKCDQQKLGEFIKDIAGHFPIRLPVPSPRALYNVCQIKRLAIIINLENDPTTIFRSQTIHIDLCKVDVLSFSEQQVCLIGSIDLLYRNSWNEVRTLHFNGKYAILEALKTIISKMNQDAIPPESVEVLCYSQNLRGLLRTRVQQLVAECIELRLSCNRLTQGKFKAIRIADEMWGIFFERLNISAQKLENAVEFYGAISKNKLRWLTVQIGTDEVHLPAVIDAYASEGVIQFFFEDGETDFNLYVLDEMNRVEVYFHCEGSKERLVYDISRFYTSSHERFTLGASITNFNLPQFYQIIKYEHSLKVLPFHHVKHIEIDKDKPYTNLSLVQGKR